VGLGAIVSEATEVTDAMFLAAAETVAEHVEPERLETGALYPPVGQLRAVSREIAIRVADEAIRSGRSPLSADADLVALVDGAMWWPAYAPYRRVGAPLTVPAGPLDDE
jgi:malic enzyme